MFATKITLLDKLLGTDSRQFIIPIYQRNYKWTSEQCNRLIDDIIKAGTTGHEHFTGTIVYQELPGGTFKTEYLVDGQQRITTIMLILKCMQLLSKPHIQDDSDYLYVFNKIQNYIYADKDDFLCGLKLIPGENDLKIFSAIMTANDFKEIETGAAFIAEQDNNLYNNFKTIYKRIKAVTSNGYSIKNILLNGLKLLVIIEMSLDMYDDPQAIFESINSLGVRLSNSDLIRNYLLMSNRNQKELYTKYWKIIQDNYIGEGNMEDFIFNYLMMKKSYAINKDNVYKEFVLFANEEFKDGNIDKEKLLIDLYDAAKIYQVFIKNTNTFSADTNMLMQELRDMGQTTAYPFLMKVFIDKENGVITENVLNQVINLIVIYLVRRTICGVPTHSLRGFMLNLYNRVFKIEGNKNKYYEAVFAFLSQLQTNDKLRSVDEMRNALKTIELYKNGKFATYLLYKIENGRFPDSYEEFTLSKNVSVEHIMPQTMTEEWALMLGDNAKEIHSKYLNTLGNLSLSSSKKNSIMSNDSFISKRDILLREGSKFIELNKDISANQTSFGETELKKRCERLSNIICSKYDLGSPNIEGIKFEEYVEIVCSTDYEDVFRSATPIGYKFFDKEFPTDSFSNILFCVATMLLEKYPEKMRELASKKFNPWGGDIGCIHFTTDTNDKDKLIGEDIRIHTNYNSQCSVQFATLLMKEFNIDAGVLIIYLKKDSIKTYNILSKKNRIEIVRNALKILDTENKIIYNPINMPKSDDWIKFQTTKLNTLFAFEGKTKWDGEFFNSICYLEYDLSSNSIYITYKKIKNNEKTTNTLIKYQHELHLLEEMDKSSFWRLKKYDIDYKAIYESTNKIEEMKKQIESSLTQIKSDLDTFEFLS